MFLTKLMAKYFSYFIVAIISFLFISSIYTKQVFGQSILFQDNFEDSDITDWTIYPAQYPWVINNSYGSNMVGSIITFPMHEAQNGDYSWTDYEFSVDILPIDNFDRNIFFRATPNRVAYYNLTFPIGYGLHLSPTYITLQKYTSTMGSNSPDIPGQSYNFPANDQWQVGIKRNIKVIVKGNLIKVYYDDIAKPVLEYADNNDPVLSGRIAIVHASGGQGHSEVYFDNVIVKSLPPDAPTFPSLNVPIMSQKNTTWGLDIYDHANVNDSWSNGYIRIYNWGCALTSAAMVLKFHGHPVDPGILNTWLKSVPDGYIGNGLINWIAVSRYSLINKTPTSPALEFLRIEPTNENLLNEIVSGRPAILNVGKHFVVAKSQTASSFGINDPLVDSGNRELSYYGGSFNALNTFTPSNTDLSYILLVTNTPNLTFYDSGGNVINGVKYSEGPIQIDETGLTSETGTVYTIMVPKPTVGTYKVDVSGTGNYFLDYYAYDQLGNPQILKMSGIFDGTRVEQYELTYGGTATFVHTNPPVVTTITLDDILKAWEQGYHDGKIKKQTYQLIRHELIFNKHYDKKKYGKTVEKRLKTIKKQVSHLPSKMINHEFASDFTKLIDTYLSQ
jgi:hypothetical protein